jgi:hypothetical protein
MKLPVRLLSIILPLVVLFAAAGCNTFSKKKDYTRTEGRFLIEANSRDAYMTVTLPVSGVQIAVNNRPVVTEFDFTGVDLAQSDMGKFLVFKLTAEAARDVYRLTTVNQGRRLVLFINGAPVGARVLEGPLNTGAIEVFVGLPDEILPELVKNLNATSVDMQKEIAKSK